MDNPRSEAGYCPHGPVAIESRRCQRLWPMTPGTIIPAHRRRSPGSSGGTAAFGDLRSDRCPTLTRHIQVGPAPRVSYGGTRSRTRARSPSRSRVAPCRSEERSARFCGCPSWWSVASACSSLRAVNQALLPRRLHDEFSNPSLWAQYRSEACNSPDAPSVLKSLPPLAL